jgi:membrane protein DedA with SNARE-associated domain
MRHPVLKKLVSFASAALNAIFMAITFGLLFVVLFKKEWVAQFLAFIEALVLSLGNWNYLVAFVFSVIESFPVIGVLIPGQQVMILVGGFFGKEHLPEMIAVCAAGAIIGNFVGYALGKRYGKSFFREYGDTFGLGRTELKYLEKQVAKNGPLFIIVGKFHNMTRAFVPFIAGSGGMHPKRFWPYNVLGSILWAATIIVLSVAFVKYYRTILDYIGYAFLAFILLFMAYVWFFRRESFLKYLEEKRIEIEGKTK